MFVRIDVCDVMCDVMCEQRYIIMRLIISLSVCDVCVCVRVYIYLCAVPIWNLYRFHYPDLIYHHPLPSSLMVCNHTKTPQ
jgi:hypothetical protein